MRVRRSFAVEEVQAVEEVVPWDSACEGRLESSSTDQQCSSARRGSVVAVVVVVARAFPCLARAA